MEGCDKPDPALAGAVDIHFHVGPDSYPRSIDALNGAKLALSRGMRGAVLKHHYSQTAGLACLARKAAPGFEAFGGIALDTPVGGLNVEAIRVDARDRFVALGRARRFRP